MNKNNEIINISDKIFGRKKESNIIDVYHCLMVTYGYIPFDEFKKIDAWLVDELVSKINKMGGKK